MRKEFFDRASAQLPKVQRVEQSFQALEAVFSRLDLLCAKNEALNYQTCVQNGWIFEVSHQLPEKPVRQASIRIDANGWCQFRGSLKGIRDLDTGTLSVDQAKTLLVSEIADLYPFRSREGVRNFLKSQQDSVTVEGKTVARLYPPQAIDKPAP